MKKMADDILRLKSEATRLQARNHSITGVFQAWTTHILVYKYTAICMGFKDSGWWSTSVILALIELGKETTSSNFICPIQEFCI